MAQSSLRAVLAECHTALQDVVASQKVAEQNQQDMHTELVRLRRIMIGESEPEKGMLMRLVKCEEKLEEVVEERKNVKNYAVSAFFGAAVSLGSTLWHKITG